MMNHPHRHNQSPGQPPYRFEHGSTPWMRMPVGTVGPPAFRPLYGIPMVSHTIPSNIPHMRPALQTPPASQSMAPQTMMNPSGSVPGSVTQQIPMANNSPGEPLSLTTKKSLPSPSPSDEYQPLDLRVFAKKPRVSDPDQPLDLSKGPRPSHQPQRKMVATVKPKMAAAMFHSPSYAPTSTRDATMVKTETKTEIESPVASTSTNLSSTASLIGDHPVDDILYLHCKSCQSSYGSVHGFRKHFRTTHGYQPTSDDVLIQGIKATREYVAQQSAAANTNTDLKPRYHCVLCGWQYDARAEMVIEQHRNTHKDSSICCVYCKETFIYQGRLIEHLSQNHPENYQFICSICKMAFPVDHQLSFHMQSTHGMLVSRGPPQYGTGQRSSFHSADRTVTSPSTHTRSSPVMKLERPRSHTGSCPATSASNQTMKAEPRSADTSTSAPSWMSLLDKVVEQELGAESRGQNSKNDNVPSLPAVQASNSEPRNLSKIVYPRRTPSRTPPTSQSVVTSTDHSAPTSLSFSMMHQHLERAITRELLTDDNDEQSPSASIKPADSSKSPSQEQLVNRTSKEKSQSPNVTSSKQEEDNSAQSPACQSNKIVLSENKTIQITEVEDDDDDEPRNLTIVEEPTTQPEEQGQRSLNSLNNPSNNISETNTNNTGATDLSSTDEKPVQ